MMKGAKTLTVSSGNLSSLSGSCLWIRTGSGPQMGFGHLKRTMTLARNLKDCCLPLFLIDPSDRWSREQLADQGLAFIYEPVETIWSHLPDPKAVLIDTRENDGIRELVEEAKKRNLPVISIHDLGLNPIASDIAIDGSIAPNFKEFPNPAADFYGGTSYMILDPSYRFLFQRDKVISETIHTVFINLGGGNSGRYFTRILEGLKLWNRELEVLGAAGFYSWGQDSLARKDWGPIHFRWCRGSISYSCFRADLAITAGGISAYEALCAGTPLMALAHDRYQRTTIQSIAKENACLDLGLGEDLDPVQLPEILSGMETDREKRRMYSERGRAIADGRGIERVAHIIREAIDAFPAVSLLEGVG
jgi:spore coat polysaccharide biosynthesis predicted glycosyltransferase SpsG